MIPFRYSPSGILTAVHPRVAALAVLSWLLVVGVAAAQPEATEPQTLSLDDLVRSIASFWSVISMLCWPCPNQ